MRSRYDTPVNQGTAMRYGRCRTLDPLWVVYVQKPSPLDRDVSLASSIANTVYCLYNQHKRTYSFALFSFKNATVAAMKDKKDELTPGLARDRAATWRLIMNFDSSVAIECLTCAATWRKR